MKLLLLAVFSVFVCATALCEAEDLTQSVRTELEGEWKPLSIRSDNEPVPGERLAEMTFSFRGALHVHAHKTLTVHQSKAKFRVDPSKTPKEIDFEILDDAEPAPRIAAIYKLDGDQMTIVFNRKAREVRPKTFPTDSAPGADVIVLKRATKAE